MDRRLSRHLLSIRHGCETKVNVWSLPATVPQLPQAPASSLPCLWLWEQLRTAIYRLLRSLIGPSGPILRARLSGHRRSRRREISLAFARLYDKLSFVDLVL